MAKRPDEQYWLDRAEEARLQSERMTNADTKREMLVIAAAYRSPLRAKIAIRPALCLAGPNGLGDHGKLSLLRRVLGAAHQFIGPQGASLEVTPHRSSFAGFGLAPLPARRRAHSSAASAALVLAQLAPRVSALGYALPHF